MRNILRKIYSGLPLKRQALHFLRRVYRPSKALYKHLHFDGVMSVPVGNDRSFLMHHYGYELENAVFWEGLEDGWEKTSVGLWSRLASDASVILDVGANTGVYSLIAKAVNPEATVVAFEPVERVFSKLEHNVEINGFDVLCLPFAASNSDGEATVYDLPTEHVYSVTVNKNIHDPAVDVIPTTIRTTRIDSVIEQYQLGSIDLLKIDVETHEPEVLEGLGKYLREFRPTMLIEILTDEVGRRVEAALEGCNYVYFNIDEDLDAVRLVTQITKSDCYNYLVCDRKIAVNLGLMR